MYQSWQGTDLLINGKGKWPICIGMLDLKIK